MIKKSKNVNNDVNDDNVDIDNSEFDDCFFFSFKKIIIFKTFLII